VISVLVNGKDQNLNPHKIYKPQFFNTKVGASIVITLISPPILQNLFTLDSRGIFVRKRDIMTFM